MFWCLNWPYLTGVLQGGSKAFCVCPESGKVEKAHAISMLWAFYIKSVTQIKCKTLYCDILGCESLYQREEEGFCFLNLGGAELMIDQIGLGRDFDDGHLSKRYSFGKGLNLQIKVPQIQPMIDALSAAKLPIFLGPEDKWYRKGRCEVGNRQFIVADPDGYLLRFFEDLGWRRL